jgi:hypothetical protein
MKVREMIVLVYQVAALASLTYLVAYLVTVYWMPLLE